MSMIGNGRFGLFSGRAGMFFTGMASVCFGLSAVHAADLLSSQLRTEIEKARPNLGELPPWQEEVFENEVLTASSRFVRDYQTSGTKVSKVDVDLEGIKRYLAFHASQILKPEGRRVLLFVKSSGTCDDCGKALASIRSELKERLERRGLEVLLPTQDEARANPADAFAKRNANGWVLAEVRGEEDPDHPGDQRYALSLDFRFPGTLVSNTQKQMEILSSDSIDGSMSRLSIDAVLEMGQKTRAGFASSGAEAPPLDLNIEGATKFSVLAQLKSKLLSSLGSDYRVVENRIERGGRAAFSVYAASGERNGARVSEAIRKSAFTGFTAEITNMAPERVDLKIALMPNEPGTGR